MIKGMKQEEKEVKFFRKNLLSPFARNRQVMQTLINIKDEYWNNPRYKFMKEFCSKHKTILSVGAGIKEPVLIGATNACDLINCGLPKMREAGFKGNFVKCPCYNLTYEDDSFDVAVCSEVIEHLYSEGEIINTFKELNRVAKNWLVTTPAKGNPTWIGEPSHNFTFTEDKLKMLLEKSFGGNTWFQDLRINLLGEAPRIYWLITKEEKQ